MNDYIVSIGLEVHCELKTKTKLLCSCKNEFGGEPNTRVCPVCAALPGAMPSLSREAVDLAIKAGLAFGCEIQKFCKWDRKNFFYPDSPKAWQTTQAELPLIKGGVVEFDLGGEKKTVRINRIHLEEDAGKLIHEGNKTFIDLNRCGVPLIEIVTEPDLHSPGETVAFLEELKREISYSGVSDVKMQEGSLRVDVNLSVAKKGENIGERTETKNLNSFSAVKRSCEYEAKRQADVLEHGGKIFRETRRWDDVKGEGYVMRGKEDMDDYRYFTEPDLQPVVLSDEYIENLALSLPESAKKRVRRYIEQFNLPEYDAKVLTGDKQISDLYDDVVGRGADPKKASNFIMGSVMRLMKENDGKICVNASQIALLLNLVAEGRISLSTAKDIVLPAIGSDNDNPLEIAEKKGVLQINDLNAAEELVYKVLSENKKAVDDYVAGNKKVISFLTGAVMKASGGRFSPGLVSKTIIKKLNQKE